VDEVIVSGVVTPTKAIFFLDIQNRIPANKGRRDVDPSARTSCMRKTRTRSRR